MTVMTFKDEELKGGTYIGEGEHNVRVIDVQSIQSSKGNPMIQITVADKNKRERKEFIPNMEQTKFRVAQFAKACGFTDEELKTGIDIPQAFKGKSLRCVVTTKGKRTSSDGKEYDNHVAEFFPLDGQTTEPNWDSDDIPF